VRLGARAYRLDNLCSLAVAGLGPFWPVGDHFVGARLPRPRFDETQERVTALGAKV
jgi:hypothetical protein